MIENKRVSARANAVIHWAKEWSLEYPQALVKFNAQDKKWVKKQVNRFLGK